MNKKMVCSLLTIVFCATLGLTVNAWENSQTSPDIIIEKIPMSPEKKEQYIEDLDLKVVTYKPDLYENAWLTAVDVSQSEMIAVAFNNESIAIADKNFNIQYLLKFNANGLSYYINWNGDNLELFFNRDNVIYSISMDGQLLDVNTFEEGCEAVSDAREKQSDTINGNVYTLKHSRFLMKLAGTKYDNLVRTDSNGNDIILFQSEKTVPLEDICSFAFYFAGLIFMGAVISAGIIVPKKIRKHLAKNRKVN